MGNVYIFRGIAATGKTVLTDRLARELSVPVLRKDDIVVALKRTQGVDPSLISNAVCYNILCRMIQTNLDVGADMILDIALGDRENAAAFFDRLNFQDAKRISFFVTCSDQEAWKRRHIERLKNPTLSQSFKSLEHVLAHYQKADAQPFAHEYVIDTAVTLEESFAEVMRIVAECTQDVEEP